MTNTPTDLLLITIEIAFLILASFYVAKFYYEFRLVGGRKEKYKGINSTIASASNYVHDTCSELNEKTKTTLKENEDKFSRV